MVQKLIDQLLGFGETIGVDDRSRELCRPLQCGSGLRDEIRSGLRIRGALPVCQT